MCGENRQRVKVACSSEGSSPRVRGKRLKRIFKDAGIGLIPACAGKTPGMAPRRPSNWAHPRVCGENPNSLSSKPAMPGSSPRVRGKHPVLVEALFNTGLIPACAGKTQQQRAPLSCPWAHPRVCGENEFPQDAVGLFPGSSPRVRGKRGTDHRAS